MKVSEKDVANLKKIPSWVKCMNCGGKPSEIDWLIDVMAETQGAMSNVLIHQSCARGQGKFAGLNIGLQKGEQQ